MQQIDLFRCADDERLGRLIRAATQPSTVFVLPCGGRKASASAEARSLYISPRFRKLRQLVEDLGTPYRIASAQHGLIDPRTVLTPYDLDLASLPLDARRFWADDILSALARETDGEIILLLAGDYAESVLLANAARTTPLQIYSPLASMAATAADEWIGHASTLAERLRDLHRLYTAIAGARARGETFRLRELGDRPLPQRGVYLFLDPEEPGFAGGAARIVRIGTHGVSRGSKSTLRGRLRNHAGPSHGAGSHRGSIFRLHVGRAMLEAQPMGWAALPSWGVGQHATKMIQAVEREHEERVSDYLGNLEVFVLPIDDAPSKDSLRAKVEMQLIGLMTANQEPLEQSSPNWLGRNSPVAAIATTGIWNIRGIGRLYWPKKTGSISDLIASRVI